MAANLTNALESARRDLLDLGLRNPLLNYRPLRSKGVEIIDELPAATFQILVRQEKRMTFLPTGKGEGDDEGQLSQPEDEAAVSARHTDLRLQTPYTSEQLQTRLLATYHAARTSIEEQGVNTLYLALGMLKWRENDTSDKFYRAPLILIPAELQRTDARHRFYLKYTGEDIGENVSLIEKLKQEFCIKSLPDLADPDDLDVGRYFEQIRLATSAQAGWCVEAGAIALEFFSFGKFLMYRDLNSGTWPEDRGILRHPILQSLLGDGGFQATASQYQDDGLLDDQLRDRQVVQAVDADSSQTIALLDALDGHNMVIQGPPGTGKSQTIVNLIAGAIGEGKKVLFVSEKMAALDVVKRRLDKARIGAACLELHSNRTNKRTIVQELKNTVYAEKPAGPGLGKELALLSEVRGKLNAYCKAVNDPIAETGETPCTAYGKLLAALEALKGLETPSLRLDGAERWTHLETARRRELVEQLQDRVAASGVPVRHIFWGCRLTVVLPTDKENIRGLAVRVGVEGERYRACAKALAVTCGATQPANLEEAVRLRNSAEHVAGSPELGDTNTETPEWLACESEIRQVLDTGKRYSVLRREYQRVLRPDAWTRDVSGIRQIVAEWGGRWWRVISSRWRDAARQLASLCTGAVPAGRASQLALLDTITEASECVQKIVAAESRMVPLFRSGWKGLDSEWPLLEKQTSWIVTAQRSIRQGIFEPWCAGPGIASIDRGSLRREFEKLDAAGKSFLQAVGSWKDRLNVDEGLLAEGPLSAQPFSSLLSRWAEQSAHTDSLYSMVAFNQIAAECEKESLAPVTAVASSWESAGDRLTSLYDRARLSSLLDWAFGNRPPLASFDGGRHTQVVDQFRRLDLLQLEYDRTSLAAKHAQSLPAGGGSGEIGVLWREFEKKTRFLPIRSIMLKAGTAIQAIKPVFMMSPLSIANYLPPGALQFDLVIFDEASQVKPVDALGAIARGKQAVVVGDSMQMPPGNFFESLVNTNETEPEEAEYEAATSDIESILGLFCARAAHQRMLRWHYRSRHESLIAVSNHLFYQDRLIVFPSPDRERKNLGLRLHRVENAPYDRGRSRTNPEEAKIVAAAVMEHARSQLALSRERRETLGVAAFSAAQMDAIQKQVEFLRRQDPSCEEFFAYPPHEPFFVKNLENVQGDERDVIFISVGYGRAAGGSPPQVNSFGPLNRRGGERRLNVLISRARQRCEVFTTVTADDIDTSATTYAGVGALKTFLRYAESGNLETASQTERMTDSDFEQVVLGRLRQLGHEVHTRVGCAGFYLDLAVVDPARPGRYVLGIECDGARYDSARSARDRDRLRQEVLQGLGWRIHRIWSTDWFRNPDEELRKAVLAIESAKMASGEPTASATPNVRIEATKIPEPGPVPAQLKLIEHEASGSSIPPYECARISLLLGGVEIHQVERGKLAGALAEVVRVESPVHWLEAARRVLDGAGVQRLGSRIQGAFHEAIQIGLAQKLFTGKGDFLWSREMREPAVRDRTSLPASSRALELIAPEEIRAGILAAVQQSYGIVPDELPSAVCKMFGFSRVTDDMRSAIEPHRDAMLREGYLAKNGPNLVVVEPK